MKIEIWLKGHLKKKMKVTPICDEEEGKITLQFASDESTEDDVFVTMSWKAAKKLTKALDATIDRLAEDDDAG